MSPSPPEIDEGGVGYKPALPYWPTVVALLVFAGLMGIAAAAVFANAVAGRLTYCG